MTSRHCESREFTATDFAPTLCVLLQVLKLFGKSIHDSQLGTLDIGMQTDEDHQPKGRHATVPNRGLPKSVL